MSGKLLSAAQVIDRLGISRTTLWRMERSAEFPAGLMIGKRSKRWREEDIDAFVERCMGGAAA